MKDKIRILALGGLDSNGNNCYCIEINDEIYVVSAGLGYPDKFASGIDFIIPDFSYLIFNSNKVKAYLLCDGHEDSLGAISYFYSKVKAPIYLTKYTKYQLLNSCKNKNVKEMEFDINVVNANDSILIGNRIIKFFQVCHSLPQSCGIAISTNRGNIVFSGDFIIEYGQFRDFRFEFKELSKISDEENFLLLMDSKNSQYSGFTSPKHRTISYLKQALNNTKGRLYISLYNDNIYNLVESITECINADKYLCFFDKESFDIYDSLQKENIINIDTQRIITYDDLGKYKDSAIVIVIIGNGEYVYQKISSLSLKDIKEKRLYINEDDTFLLLTPPSANFEVFAVSCLDELYKTNCNVINVSRKQLLKMHPAEEDIKLFISLINPKFYIPIKGQYKDLIANANIAASINIGLNHKNIMVLDNGMAVDFIEDDAPKFNFVENEQIKIGYIMIDGNGVGDVANEIINERNLLSNEGIVVMSLLVSKTKRKIVGGPDIQMRGFLYIKESEPVIKGIQNIFVEIVEKHLSTNSIFNKELCIKEVKDNVSKYNRKTTLRCPIVEPEILIID